MKQLSAFLLLSVLPLGATCTGSSPTWRCPSTGNAVNDGTDLRTFLGGSDGSSIAYSLGDTIILDAGAEYDTPLSSGNPQVFTLPKQVGCTNGSKKTKIVGTRSGEFPKGYTVTKADITKMPVLKQVGAAGYNGGILQFFDSNSTHNGCGGTCVRMTFGCFEIDGIAFVQGKEFAETHNIAVGAPLIKLADDQVTPTAMDQLPHDMILRHVLATNSQELDYGTLANCQSKACAFRSTATGISFNAVRVLVEDSAIYGLGGFDPTGGRTPVTVTCTKALPATCSGTGLAATLGLVAPAGSECINPRDSLLSCMNDCYGHNSCVYGVLDGPPSGWHDTNSDGSWKLNNIAGSLALTYINSTTVSVDRLDQVVLYEGNHVDTTGNPSWSGTATIVKGNPQLGDSNSSPPYNFDTGNVSDIHLIHNYMENGSMGFFVSGGGFPTAYGTVLAGSTSTTINVGSVTGYATLGDIGYFPVASPSVSIYCNGTGAPCTGKGCCFGDYRQFKIIGISGSPVAGYILTVAPFGPGGIDIAPVTGVAIKWKGLLPSNFSFRKNTVRRWYNSPPLGKGLELKSAENGLIDGNTLIGIQSGIFLEPKNQIGNTPWATGRNLQMQNNVAVPDPDPNGGTSTSSPVRYNLPCGDYEWSTTPCWNVWYSNNIFIDMWSVSGALDMIEMQTSYNSGFRHNYGKFNATNFVTWNFASDDKSVAGANLECNSYEVGNTIYSHMFHYLNDNIVSYGYGISTNQAIPGDQCWVNQTNYIKRNVFVSDQLSPTAPIATSVINAAWPGNGGGTGAATNWAAVTLVGTCAAGTLANCALDPSSAYKGIGAGGSDPGPDVPQVIDHLNGWSERAGLIQADIATASFINNPAAFVIGSTNAAVSFRLFGDTVSNCTFILYTNASRQTEHGDTNTGPEKACNRTGSLFQNGTVTFVLGINTALTANTTYYYLITDGVRIMPGSFKTLAANVVGIITSQLYDTVAADAFYYSSTSTSMSSPTAESPVAFASNRVTIEYSPLSGVRYYKIRKRDGGAATLWESLIGVTFR